MLRFHISSVYLLQSTGCLISCNGLLKFEISMSAISADKISSHEINEAVYLA